VRGCLKRPTPANVIDERDDRLPDNRHHKISDARGNPRQPKFSNLFMGHLLSRNSRIEGDVVDQLFNSSEKRLAHLLLLLANYGKEGSPPIAPVTVSQETLAAMIGTTRSQYTGSAGKITNCQIGVFAAYVMASSIARSIFRRNGPTIQIASKPHMCPPMPALRPNRSLRRD
jgi:hypothetical protein